MSLNNILFSPFSQENLLCLFTMKLLEWPFDERGKDRQHPQQVGSTRREVRAGAYAQQNSQAVAGATMATGPSLMG